MRNAFGKINFPNTRQPNEKRSTMAKKATKKVVKKKSAAKKKKK
jgi:hypothetical protein